MLSQEDKNYIYNEFMNRLGKRWERISQISQHSVTICMHLLTEDFVKDYPIYQYIHYNYPGKLGCKISAEILQGYRTSVLQEPTPEGLEACERLVQLLQFLN